MKVHTSGSQSGTNSVAPQRLPHPPIQRWVRPFVRFVEIESASGLVLLLATAVALVLANSPWSVAFAEVWQTRVSIAFGDWQLNKPLLLWINDGLMTIFFFVVGLEIKRELVAGELREPKKAALPLLAALGGMVAPGAIYFSLQAGHPGEPGWGIPMATDIAFVVGFLALLGQRVPLGLKILLLSLAIADDIGAVLVIAFFYSSSLSIGWLGVAVLGFALTSLLNRIGVRRITVYFIVGAGIWLAFLKSGVHPTVAGVLLGLLTPAWAWIGEQTLLNVLHAAMDHLRDQKNGEVEPHQRGLLVEVESAAREVISPLERLQVSLHPWVAFGIMPLFALANAGVSIQPEALASPVAFAVIAGLFIGKPLGIVLLSWVAVRLGLASLPGGVNWKTMIGAGSLAGIGFTMSLFIAGLALTGELLDSAKIGTLAGSALSAAVGCLLLLKFLPPRRDTTDAENQRQSR